MKPGRPRKLDKEAESFIQLRVLIAKETQLFSQKAIADGFELSIMTLRRYYIPKERRASQILATRKYLQRKLIDHSHCDDCNVPFRGHPRCQDCRILLHFDPQLCRCGEQHGRTINGEKCITCFDIAASLILKALAS